MPLGLLPVVALSDPFAHSSGNWMPASAGCHRGIRTSRGLPQLLMAIAVALFPGVSFGASLPPEPEAPADGRGDRIRVLESSKWQDRERAHEQIGEAGSKSLASIEDALKRNDLSVEQRQRLMNLGRDLFERSPRAAMGISWNEQNVERSVIIGGAVPGFDCSRVLMPSDQLLAISGYAVRSRDGARSSIMSHNPGERAVVDVLRRGEIETFEVLMGSFDDLAMRRAEPPNRAILDWAWSIRVERLTGGGGTGSVNTGLDPDDWIALESVDDRALQETNERLAQENVSLQRMVRIGEEYPIVHARRTSAGLMAASPFQALEVDPSVAGNGAVLKRQYEIFNMELGRLRQQAQRPDLDPAVRFELLAKISALEQSMIAIKKQMPVAP